MEDNKIIVAIVVVILAVGGGLFWMSGGTANDGVSSTPNSTSAPVGALSLAQCLADKGVTFYGAFWCPHCKKQKANFGSAQSALPYVECSTPDGNGQLPVCKEKGVESYPTWVFPDGTKATGEQSFDDLRKRSGCGGESSSPVASSTERTTTTTIIVPGAEANLPPQ